MLESDDFKEEIALVTIMTVILKSFISETFVIMWEKEREGVLSSSVIRIVKLNFQQLTLISGSITSWLLLSSKGGI